MKLSKSNAIAVGAIAVVGIVLFILWRPTSSYSIHLDARFESMRLLGDYIRQEKPGANVLLMGNPFVQRPDASDKIQDHDTMGHEGLVAGLGETAKVTKVYPELSGDYLKDPNSVFIPPRSKTPLSFIVEAASFQSLAESHPDHQVVVSLIGLPKGIQKQSMWKESDPTSFALLLPDFRLLGRSSDVIAQFENGKILAVVIKDADTGEPLVVHKGNAAQVIKAQPKSFGW